MHNISAFSNQNTYHVSSVNTNSKRQKKKYVWWKTPNVSFCNIQLQVAGHFGMSTIRSTPHGQFFSFSTSKFLLTLPTWTFLIKLHSKAYMTRCIHSTWYHTLSTGNVLAPSLTPFTVPSLMAHFIHNALTPSLTLFVERVTRCLCQATQLSEDCSTYDARTHLETRTEMNRRNLLLQLIHSGI